MQDTFKVRLYDLTGDLLDRDGVDLDWPANAPVPTWGEGFTYQKKVGIIGDCGWVYDRDRFGVTLLLELYLVDGFEEDDE